MFHMHQGASFRLNECSGRNFYLTETAMARDRLVGETENHIQPSVVGRKWLDKIEFCR